MKTEEEWTRWHDDGHEITVEVCVEIGQPALITRVKPKYVAVKVPVHCPEHSFCRRWAAEHDADHLCFVDQEIRAVGHWDFIEQMETGELPDDWSSVFPLRITWRDQGEDGLTWKPSKSPLTQFFERAGARAVRS